LQRALELARHFQPLTDSEKQALLARTREASASKQFELYKTSQHFDGTTKNPEWLG
jgi:hypothetical protein